MDYWGIIVFLAGVTLTGFFAGYETGFVSANFIRIRHRAEKDRKNDAMRLLTYYERPARLISMLLIGTHLSLVIGATALTWSLGAGWAMVIAAPIFLLFAEIFPKSVFRQYPTRLVLLLFPVVRFFEGLLAPLSIPVAWISLRFVNMIDGNGRGLRMLLTSLEDMRSLVDESVDQGSIDPEEHEMIHSVIDLQTQCAHEVMVPRIRIQALPTSASRKELVARFAQSGQSRIPIYEDTVDHVLGVANVFDVIRDPTPEIEDIQRFIKPILHVPDSMKLDDVLRAMRDARQSMAIVTDEFGGTDGLVTVEDVLEEIFGEIHDEYDNLPNQIQRVGPNAYVIDAQMNLEEVASVIHAAVTDREVETVSGWVSRIAGRIPSRGEVLLQGPFRITILEGAPNHISSIRLDIADPPVAQQQGKTEH